MGNLHLAQKHLMDRAPLSYLPIYILDWPQTNQMAVYQMPGRWKIE